MKISQIHLTHFGRYPVLDLELAERVTVLLGRNGAGKSTIVDGIRAGLTGTARRFPRGSAKELATWGSGSWGVGLGIEIGDAYSRIRRTATTLGIPQEDGPTTKLTQAQLDRVLGDPKLIDALMDVSRATTMPAADLKAMVFSLAGISVTAEDLRGRGLTDDEVLRLALAGDWKKAERVAAESKRSLNRSAEELARTAISEPEEPVLPAAPEDPVVTKDTRASEVSDDFLAEMRESLRGLRNSEREISEARARATAGPAVLRERREKVAKLLEETHPEKDEAELAETRKALQTAQQTLDAARMAIDDFKERHPAKVKAADAATDELTRARRATEPHACPICHLEHQPKGGEAFDFPALEAAAKTAGDELAKFMELFDEARAKETELVGVIEEGMRREEHLTRDDGPITMARRRAKELESLDAEIAAGAAADPEKLAEELSALRVRIEKGDTIVGAIERYRTARDEWTRACDSIRTEHAKAVAKAKSAAAAREQRLTELRESAKAYGVMETLCRPDGIQSDLLAPALDPIRERLGLWLDLVGVDVTVTGDFEVLACPRGGDGTYHPVAALSGSEQWRVALAMADALAQLSGLRWLVLDEIPGLDPDVRGDLSSALVAIAPDYDQIIACLPVSEMFTEQAPEELPVRLRLVEGGKVELLPAAVAHE